MKKQKQAWIYSAPIDSIFFLGPAFFSLILVYLFLLYFSEENDTDLLAWIILVVFIDVAHVYSTLYRTYFDREMLRTKKTLLVNVPLLSLIGGILVYEMDAMIFWRFLAYLAVFHFIRQQYGFLRLYSRKEVSTIYLSAIDTLCIYVATLYPILYWHLQGPRNFNWFLKGDFYYFSNPMVTEILKAIYILAIGLYVSKELVLAFKQRWINVPKNLLVAGTISSWYFGIVYFNGDLIFTLINVVSHGIPYMALVWVYGHKSNTKAVEKKQFFYRYYAIPLFLGILFLFAFIEEGFWDALVWNDHHSVFSGFYFLPKIAEHHLLAFLVPVLSLPQMTHYVLDGFIWRVSKEKIL